MRRPRASWAIACALLLASGGLTWAGARAVELDRPDADDLGVRGAGRAPAGIYFALGGDPRLEGNAPIETVQIERRYPVNPVDLRTAEGAVLFRYWVLNVVRELLLLP